MHVAIHGHRSTNLMVALQSPDGHGHIVNHAESLAMVGKGVVKAATNINSNAVDRRVLRRQYSDSATRGCEGGNPSVVMDLDVEEKAREIRLRFCEAISGKEAYRYAPERLGRSGGGTKPRGRAKAVTRDQGERLGEAISCRNSAVIRRAQRTWLVSLRAVALRLSAKKAWKRL